MQTMSQPQLKISTETIRQANLKSGFYHRHPSSPDSSPQHPPQQKYRAPENQDRKSDTAAESNCLLQRHGYSIHLIKSLKQRIKASTLIKRMYASRGYQTGSASVFSETPYQYTLEARPRGTPSTTAHRYPYINHRHRSRTPCRLTLQDRAKSFPAARAQALRGIKARF